MEQPLGSRYVLQDLLGRGAMGQVFRGTVRGSGAAVAVKVLKPELVSDTEVVARFFQERSILTAINHPNVAKVLDLVVEGDTLGIVMELVEGQDLRRYLRARGTLPPGEAVWLVCQLLHGLTAVHAGGVVHRDVKPENVLLSSRGELKLTDFGVSRLSYGASLTKMTSLIGTPEYMAPELADHDTASPAADLYSTGIVLYEMLAGRTPFAGGHPLAVLRRQVEQPPPPVPGVPAGLWEEIESLLAKDPRSRPGSAGAALNRLAPLQSRLGAVPALPQVPNRLAPTPGQTMPGREAGRTGPGREPGQTVLRARDRGQVLGGETEPPTIGSGRGRARAQRRRRAVLIALPAAVVILAAAAGLLLTHSLHAASPVADLQPTAARDVSVLGQPTPANTATGPTIAPTPATSQPGTPAGASAPSVTQTSPAAAPQTSPAAAPQTSLPAGPTITPAPPPGITLLDCGPTCVALYSPFYGASELLGVVGQEETTGQPVDMQPAEGTNPAEMWVLALTGPVSNFYNSGLVSAAIDRHYGSNAAYEYEYTPYGILTGLCLGVSGTAQNGTSVTLQACGVSAATVWISDTADEDQQQAPLISATTTNFTQPFVLTDNGASVNIATSSLANRTGQYWNTEY